MSPWVPLSGVIELMAMAFMRSLAVFYLGSCGSFYVGPVASCWWAPGVIPKTKRFFMQSLLPPPLFNPLIELLHITRLIYFFEKVAA